MMEAACSFRKLVSTYKTTRCHIPRDHSVKGKGIMSCSDEYGNFHVPWYQSSLSLDNSKLYWNYTAIFSALQESEIYQKCIRPPPNRTVFDGESPPPYRTSSAGVLGSGDPGDWSSGGSSTTRVVRCHSVSSGSSASRSIHAPSVIVPTGSRRLSSFSDSSGGGGGGALASLTMVPCNAEPSRLAKPPPPQHGAVWPPCGHNWPPPPPGAVWLCGPVISENKNNTVMVT